MESSTPDPVRNMKEGFTLFRLYALESQLFFGHSRPPLLVSISDG
jgi:hypothetical protein